MFIENPEALKAWLTTILEPKCDADPNALAKYVIALVKKDKLLPDLKETCIDQLDVFLQQETKPFVELLFKTLDNKSYLKKNEPQSPALHPLPIPLPPSTQPQILPQENPPLNTTVVSSNSSSSNASIPHITLPTTTNIARESNKDSRDSRRISRSEGLHDTDEREKRLPRKSSPVNRSRSRSRSRSSRSRSRNRSRSRSRDRDERRPRRYNEDIKRDRRGPLPRRYDRYNDYRHDRIRDRDRSRDRDRESERGRERDRTRSRSRTPRSRTRSRSRSRERGTKVAERSRTDGRDSNHKTQSPTKTEHGDKDYRYSTSSQSTVPTNASSASLPPVPGTVGAESQAMFAYNRGGKSSRRCRDFDEMGYCMRGDLCPYDHGTDPVVVEDVNLPGMIGFAPTAATQELRPSAPTAPIPPIMAHPPIPRPPLPPPPPHPPGIKVSTDAQGRFRNDSTPYFPEPYMPEPYNPEAPSLDRPPRIRPPYWNPRPSLPRGIGLRPPPLFPQQMTRELISVPTIDNATQQDASKGRMVMVSQKRTFDGVAKDGSENCNPIHEPNNNNSNSNNNNANNVSLGGGDLANKRRSFDFNRLGPRKSNLENATLELRKIPRGLNSITQLNNHFAKFGKIVNLQVCYEGNPEAALITFSSHAEANAAYRSTEAVLNNRFIKVFWHNKDNTENPKYELPVAVAPVPPFGNKKLSVKDRLGVPVTNPTNNDNNNADSQNAVTQHPGTVREDTEKTSVVLSPTGNLSKTVFNPAALKKNNVAPATGINQVMSTQETVKKKQVEQKKAYMKFNARKQELLEKNIQNQKSLIERLEKNKNMLPAERDQVILAIKSIQECIDNFKKEVVVPVQLTPVHPKTKTEAQKQLLDIEMDLYNKQHQGADTSELKKRVAELKQEARALGLLDSGRGRGRGRGRGIRGIGAIRGLSLHRGRGFRSSSVSVDHRPRKLLVSGLEESERHEAMLQLAQFGEIEGIDHDDVNRFTILTFQTRKEAELFAHAMRRDPKFREKPWNVSWYKDNTADLLSEGVDVEADVLVGEDELGEDMENVELLLADDEEEEDSEARSWKR